MRDTERRRAAAASAAAAAVEVRSCRGAVLEWDRMKGERERKQRLPLYIRVTPKDSRNFCLLGPLPMPNLSWRGRADGGSAARADQQDRKLEGERMAGTKQAIDKAYAEDLWRLALRNTTDSTALITSPQRADGMIQDAKEREREWIEKMTHTEKPIVRVTSWQVKQGEDRQPSEPSVGARGETSSSLPPFFPFLIAHHRTRFSVCLSLAWL